MTDERQDNDRTVDSKKHTGMHERTVSSSGGDFSPNSRKSMPEEIGGYRIVGVLGEGGMGIVYEAEQPSPRRRVALKVIRGAEVVDDLRLKMFQREAETLARLDHPNIGAIFESGRTEEGQHFFAMELVRGRTLGEWLASRPANPDSAEIDLRLRLFSQICYAVHYAHQRGVIHRDLKPSNLVVTDLSNSHSGSDSGFAPMIKILDFGLARITEEDVAMTQVTEIGVIKGTLPYMAPEQASGRADEIDVRTDVYALGVILYELMTGERPYSTDTGSLLSAVKVICEQAPFSLAEKWKAKVRLNTDLATIAGVALEKDPDRRYASAAAFGDDIVRLMSSQPILARPASTMYQLKKLVTRRKALFATIAASLVLLVFSAIGIGVLYVLSEANLERALEAEENAVLEARTAERTSDFIVDLFHRVNPEITGGETITAREVMDEGARRVREELNEEPLMQATLMNTIGSVYMSLGLFDEARSLIDEALALRQAHLPPGDIVIAASQLQRARVLGYQGDPHAARQVYDTTIALYETIGEPGQDGLIDALGNLGWMLGEMGEAEAGLAAANRAQDLLTSTEPLDEERLLGLLINKSSILLSMGMPDSALPLLNVALRLSEDLHGEIDVQNANILTNLSIVYARLGHLDSTYTQAAAALDIYTAIYGEDHPMTAKAVANVGISLAQQGKFAEALPHFEQGLEILTTIHGPEHPEVARGFSNIGLLKLQSGDAAAAVKDLEKAASMLERLLGPSNPPLSYALYHLASARGALGEHDKALKHLQRVVAIDEKIYGAESQEVADDLEGVVSVLRLLGRGEEANENEARMHAILNKLGTPASEASAD